MQRTKHTKPDMINGSILQSMLAFAVPVLFSSLFQQLYNTADTMIVGHTLGESALAAVGAATPVYDLLMGFALGIGSGMSIVTARCFGAKSEERLKASVAAALVIGALVSLVMTVGSRFFLLPFLRLMNTPSEILADAHSYISTILLFTGVTFAYNLLAGILRSIGNSVMPLVFLVISSVLNVFLDYFFIRSLGMGVQGAAAATVLAQGVSVVLCLVYILRRVGILVPAKRHFRPDRALWGEMLAQGLSMAAMHSLVYAGSAVLQAGINGLGYLVIAGHTAARKAYQFGMMPFVAMVSATGTFVSQNFGARRIDRIRQGVICAYLYNAAATVLMTLIFLCSAPQLIRLISGSDEAVIIANGARYLTVVAPAYVILGLVNITRTSLQSIGSKLLPLLSSIIELLGKILFVAILIPRFQYNAVIYCEPVIWCFMAAQLLLAFWTNPIVRREANRCAQ